MRKEHAPKVSRKKEDIDFEIAFYENILKATPNFIEALSCHRGLVHQSRPVAKRLGSEDLNFRI